MDGGMTPECELVGELKDNVTGGLDTRPRLSIIIPARNEEAYLPSLIDSIDAARNCYRRAAQCVEVIVSDNVSTDRTAQVARERGCFVTTVTTRNIGAVRNGGARVARGDIFFFVDADLILHPESLNEVERVLQDPQAVGGCMGARWDRWSLALMVTDCCSYILEFIKDRPHGRGTTFCRREDYQATGGYREDRYGGEDLRFIKALRDHGSTAGRTRFISCRRAKATVSTRKMRFYGDWHLVRFFFRILTLKLFHPSQARAYIQPLLEEYWYGDRR